MNYIRKQKFRGFQSSAKREGFFEIDLDPKSLFRKFLLKGLICLILIAIVFTMKVININGTNKILSYIYNSINSELEYAYYLNRAKGIPQFVFSKGEKAIEVISIPTFNTMQFEMPVRGEIVSFFDQSTTSAHTNTRGIVINTRAEDRVLAANDGTVMETGVKDNIGTYVIIKHRGNLLTIYKHLQESHVENNQAVKQGDIIGTASEKLQFEMWDRNNPVDPLRYINLNKL